MVELRWAARLEARLASLSEQEYAAFVATVQTTYEARKASGVALGEPLAAAEPEEDDRSVAVSEKSLATAATAPSRAPVAVADDDERSLACLLYTSPSPRDS